jgi:hypothetical protein
MKRTVSSFRPLGAKSGFDVGRPAMLIVRNLVGGIARSLILDETSDRALRTALFTIAQCGLILQSGSIAQLQVDAFIQLVMAIGPSTASIISASVIAAAGRASWIPPPAPRQNGEVRLWSKCSPISVRWEAQFRFRSPVPLRTYAQLPQWRDAAPITTTA